MKLAPLNTAQLSAVRLIATDIDGTLTSNHQFSPQLFTAFAQLQAANLPVVLVTGRSAGWIEALANYLPVAGVIGENGGCFVSRATGMQFLGGLKMKAISQHREKLADCFWQLQGSYTQIKESIDNRWRLTDWTFDLEGLTDSDLWEITAQCERWGWDFTYSTIQCHIKLASQNKALGLRQVIKKYLDNVHPAQVLTIGDSPNDGAMFDPQEFPLSVGVANLADYVDRISHQPAYLATQPEVHGFTEIVDAVLAARKLEPPAARPNIFVNIFQ
jgi:HAD superfamily hydrolase (TIGR01484 family)